MKRQLLSPSKVKGTGRVIKDSSWFRIPAVSKFVVRVQPYNPLLESIGIKIRLPMKFEAKTNSSDRANRYMKWTIFRIRKLVSKGEYEKAWKLVWLNMQFSKAFRLSAFNRIVSGWYYNMHYNEVWKSLRKVDKLLYGKSYGLEYKRVYIEKSNGKLRPLGVPSREWRVVLHMLNNFIVELERKNILESQHGYIPNRGTMTAWKSVLSEVESKYIYETDLKGFFDNVSIWKVIDLIRDQSSETSRWLIQLCKRVPKFGKNKVEEKYRPVIPKINKSDWLNPQSLSQQEITGHVFRYMNWWSANLPNKKDVKWQNFGIVPGGFPQGMPLSPFLSILVLKDYLGQSKVVNYADDQIFFGNEKLDIQDEKEKGIIHSAEKCQWIKEKGKWVVDSFKFLGFRLSKNYNLMSETRKGVKECINPKISKLYSLEGQLKLKSVDTESSLKQLTRWLETKGSENINLKESLKHISEKRFFGFVLACMQIGDWENNHSWEDRRKAERTMSGNLNYNSLLGRIPNNLDSSKCIPHLGWIITKIIKKNSRKTKVKPFIRGVKQ